jgi:hypothetical protein
MSGPRERELFERRRRGRNLALLAALLAAVVVLYLLAFVRVAAS